jgi:glycine dehydrogenase subunit 1
MRFIPHTETEIAEMLAAIGAGSLDDLIVQIPSDLRAHASIRLEPGRNEAEVVETMATIAARNEHAVRAVSFLGGGCYRHFIPAAVRAITGRAEFATSYTPYQPEASQGTTQAIFEFQTLITQLTGLEVANASMYDGASAAAEAVLMARRILPRRNLVAISRALWPDYRATIRTYLAAQSEIELVELPIDQSGGTAIDEWRRIDRDRLLCIVVGYPNYFGVIEPIREVASVAHQAGGLAIVVTAEALSLGLLKSPGELGADIAVGEAQSFGIAPQFGGPGLGFMGSRMTHVRQMPGRLVGQTHDQKGNRAFCLTLSAREQHIRRERATSNICTNHSLCALAATVYLSLMGKRGLRELAARNVELAHQAADSLEDAGFAQRFTGPYFNEFVIGVPNAAKFIDHAAAKGLLAGVALGVDYPEFKDGLLVSVTELNRSTDFELLRQELEKWMSGAGAEVR